MHYRINLTQIWFHDQVLVQNHSISLRSLMLAKLNAAWKSEGTAPLGWNLCFSQDPKDLLIANEIFIFQSSAPVGEWLVTTIRLPCWLMCISNKPLRDVCLWATGACPGRAAKNSLSTKGLQSLERLAKKSSNAHPGMAYCY